MNTLTIKRLCSRCMGSGVDDNGEEPGSCVVCSGEGYSDAYLIDYPTNIFRSHVILEELNATEHAALTDTQKDGVLHILACGLVDLNVGKTGRVRLWNWFGAESTTVANLTAILE